MSVIARCSCGQAFKAKLELAGKQVRCPACGGVFMVPQADPEPAQEDNDPFAGLDLGAITRNASNPLLSNPTLQTTKYHGGASTKSRRRTAGSGTGPKLVWIVLAIVGSAFGLVCLACAGLLAVGLRHVRQQAAFEQEVASFADSVAAPGTASDALGAGRPTLVEARRGFVTKIVSSGESFGPPDDPTGSEFDLIRYASPVGPLAAYLTRDPRDGKKRPAIVWITGGDNNSIGDVWSPMDRSNDQSASAFRKAGIVMMFPSQRGGNDNPGRREGFYGEVEDILAATDHLAQLPYIDPDQIYLGGHSTGGTMVMLVAECSDRYRAVFALGPVAIASQYGGDFIYCDLRDPREIALRSPLPWLHGVKSPLYVLEGASHGNWDAIQLMVDANTNPQVHFFKIAGHDHFSIIAPLAETLANQIVQGQVHISEQTLREVF